MAKVRTHFVSALARFGRSREFYALGAKKSETVESNQTRDCPEVAFPKEVVEFLAEL